MMLIELRDCMLDKLVDQAGAELDSERPAKVSRVLDGRHNAAGCGLGQPPSRLVLQTSAMVLQNACEAGAAITLFGREIGAAKKWLAVGREDGG